LAAVPQGDHPFAAADDPVHHRHLVEESEAGRQLLMSGCRWNGIYRHGGSPNGRWFLTSGL
ncbi:hypothetical protein, partial [Streptomyces sp. NPDC018347]|uniref:hypothetical protein n=1 Tax=Streptomyces sp. NPDC018347 TaxID=3157193 RepID=UPI0033D8F215